MKQQIIRNRSCAGVPPANTGITHARRRLQRAVQVLSSSNGSATSSSSSSSSSNGSATSSSSNGSATSSNHGNKVQVDGLVVQPAYRSTPWEAEQQKAEQATDKAQIMFVSESGICRGPLAAALFSHMVANSPLSGFIDVTAKASRDYCVGQQPHPLAAAVAAAALGTPLASSTAAAAAPGGAVQFEPAADIVASDLVLVMDKYTAADVLREVSSYDLINPGGYYSARVRVLGSFHPVLSQRASQADGQDIDDPLYGNFGGQREQEAVLFAAKLIHESCSSLLQQLEGLAAEQGLLDADSAAAGNVDSAAAAAAAAGSSSSNGSNSAHDAATVAAQPAVAGGAAGKFRAALVARIREEGVISWLVPPMLQGSTTDLGGWV